MKQLLLDKSYTPLQPDLMHKHIQALQNGQVSYYLLPTQTLLDQARMQYYQLAQTEVLFDRSFLTLDDIVSLILEQAGCDYYLIESAAQNVIVTRILHDLTTKKLFQYLHQMPSSAGTTTKLVNLIGELKRGNCRVENFKYSSEPNSELERKDHDLALIYQEYEQFLEQHQLCDIESLYFKAIDICQERPASLKQIDQVIIAGFSLTPLKLELVKQLSQIATTTIVYLHYDAERPALFYQSRGAKQQLAEFGFTVNTQTYQQAETCLADVLFTSQRTLPPALHLKIANWRCWSQRQEVREVIREVKRLNLRAGVPLSQMVLVARQRDAYADLVRSELERASIPYQAVGSQRLTKFAPARRLLNLIALLTREWERDIFIEIMTDRSIIWPQPIKADLIRAFLRTTAEQGPLLNWQRACQRQLHYWQMRQQLAEKEADSDLLEQAQTKRTELEAVAEGLKALGELWQQAFPTKGSFAEFAHGLRTLAAKLKLDQAQVLAADKFTLEQIQENFRAWQMVLQCLNEQEQHAQNWLDFALDSSQFYTLLRDIFHATYLPNPKPLCTGISLLSPWQLPGQEYAVVFALGFNEGNMPQPYQQDWFYDEKERSILRRQGLPFLEAAYYQAQEKMFFYNIVAAAQKRLYLSYLQQSYSNHNMMPSPFLEEFPAELEWEYKTWVPATALPRDLGEAVQQNEFYAIAARQALTEDLTASITSRLTIEKLRSANQATIYNGNLQNSIIQSKLAKRFGPNTVFSTSMFEQYGRCPFAFFMQRVLKVMPIEGLDTELTPLIQGNVIHRVLAQFLNSHSQLTEGHRPAYLQELEHLLGKILQEYQQEMTAAGAVWSNLELDRLQHLLAIWLDYELKYQAKVTLRPALFEYEFGRQNPFALQSGEESLFLRGFIDRVDQDKESFAIYDYKTGQPPRLQGVHEGYVFQMPIYLLVIQKLYPDKKAMGAGYYHLNKNMNRNRGMWRSSYLKQMALSTRIGDQVAEEEWQETLNKVQETLLAYRRLMQNGNYSLHPRVECPAYCPYRLLCRITPELMLNMQREERENELH